MTDNATDVPSAEIDWAHLFDRCAAAGSWSDFRSELYGSGVLLSDYMAVLAASNMDGDELLELGTTEQLRGLLTEQVRLDHFEEGAGEVDFWDGTFDETLAALAYPMSTDYDSPRRVLPCPTCGDTKNVQTVVFGMPAGQPTLEEEAKYYFAGCLVDGTMGDWYCPSCEKFHSVPRVNPFEWAEQESAAVPESKDTLSADELGQLYRDITLGSATHVLLDTEAKRQQFLDAQQEVRDIAARGHIIEVPE